MNRFVDNKNEDHECLVGGKIKRIFVALETTDKLQHELSDQINILIERVSCLMTVVPSENTSEDIPAPEQSEFSRRIHSQNENLLFLINKIERAIENLEV